MFALIFLFCLQGVRSFSSWRSPFLSVSRSIQLQRPTSLTITSSSALSSSQQLHMMPDDFDDDGAFLPYDEEDDQLEKQMARELYDELRQGKPGLPVADFMVWEDIVDVMSTGVIDDETMEVTTI